MNTPTNNQIVDKIVALYLSSREDDKQQLESMLAQYAHLVVAALIDERKRR